MGSYCKVCTYNNLDGAIFCEECGSRLEDTSAIETKKFESINNKTNDSNLIKKSPTIRFTNIFASLHVVSTGQILPLVSKSEFSIGRISSGQPILPDIDLSPYKAYKHGVSRLHANIKVIYGKAHIYDLNSANGVYINGERIEPEKNIELKHGDIIALGQFKLQILLNK